MSTHLGLSDRHLITLAVPGQSINAANVNSGSIDMQGWDGVAFLIDVGAITGSGTMGAYVNRSTLTNMASPTNVSGAAIATATNANKLAILEVFRPSQRFVQLNLVGLTNAVVTSVIAIRYRGSGTLLPPTQGAEQRVLVAEN